jgi:hypothetical protein
MVSRLGSGIIFGVGIWPFKKLFQFYLVILAQKMFLLQLTCIFWNFYYVEHEFC